MKHRQTRTGMIDRGGHQAPLLSGLRSFLAALLLTTLCLAKGLLADSKYNVVIITSSDSKYQALVAARIREQLDTSGTRSLIVSSDDTDTAHQNGRTLFIAIGEQAIHRLNEFDRNAMALRINSRKVPGSIYTSTQSDLLTAQPDCRNFQLIKALNDNWSSVAVLSSLHSADTAAALTKCSIRYNINLQIYAITDKSDLMVTLETAVENNKVLLAVPDTLIFNTHSVKNILLTAYRHRTPVIGYSDSFVQAGAIAAVFTPPEIVSDRAIEIVNGFFENNWQFNAKSYHVDGFAVSLNEQVAASLGLELPEDDHIRDSIARTEAKQ